MYSRLLLFLFLLTLRGDSPMLARKLMMPPARGFGAAVAVSDWDTNTVAMVHPGSVYVHNGIFFLFYRGHPTTVSSNDAEIGLATSPDGYTFTKYHNNPILSPGAAGQWDDDGVSRSSVLFESGQFVMWYQGRQVDPAVDNAIGVALSPDATNWTKYGSNPVLEKGVDVWEALYVLSPSVLRQENDPASDLIMYYQGDSSADGKDQIGVATGTDYYTWSKYASNPVILKGTAGQFDVNGAARPSAIYRDSEYKVYYYGNGGTGIGLATSADGFSFTKHASNPLLEPGTAGQWDDTVIADPWVVYHDGQYWMYYAGHGGDGIYAIGLAESDDGVTWTKYAGNPVMVIE